MYQQLQLQIKRTKHTANQNQKLIKQLIVKMNNLVIPSNFKSNILEISSKAQHACGFNTSYKLACWGIDNMGETLIPAYIENVN